MHSCGCKIASDRNLLSILRAKEIFMFKNPISGMMAEERKPEHKSQAGSRTAYLCSLACYTQFESSTRKYGLRTSERLQTYDVMPFYNPNQLVLLYIVLCLPSRTAMGKSMSVKPFRQLLHDTPYQSMSDLY